MYVNKNISSLEKLQSVKMYLSGKLSYIRIAKKYGINESSVRRWVAKYKAFGKSAFIGTAKNRKYTEAFKIKVVNAYLRKEGSTQDLAIRFKIPSKTTVYEWVLKYNNHEKLKATGIGGRAIMNKGRTTTYDERVEIIKYCIEHENNCVKAAKRYNVSYQQVYAWMKKYKLKGIEGLLDKRGKSKPESELSELEKLRLENKLLKAENRRQKMEMTFLKKIEEIERRRF